MEKCIITGNIPSAWKSYNTIMIPKPMKPGHYQEVSSWRPIALLDSSYKIFTTALCNQLKKWCDINNLMHPMQKSLGPADGCAEHNFALRALLEHYRDRLKSCLNISFLDIEEAFPSINISVMLLILRLMGLSEESIGVIESLYSDCDTSLMCGGYTTNKITLSRGVRQGCPISMLLFNITINPLLVKIEPINSGGSSIFFFHFPYFYYLNYFFSA